MLRLTTLLLVLATACCSAANSPSSAHSLELRFFSTPLNEWDERALNEEPSRQWIGDEYDFLVSKLRSGAELGRVIPHLNLVRRGSNRKLIICSEKLLWAASFELVELNDKSVRFTVKNVHTGKTEGEFTYAIVLAPDLGVPFLRGIGVEVNY